MEVITRHMESRPNFIQDNFASLDMQTCDDWVQTLLVDATGHSVEWANYWLGKYGPNLIGEYIWVFDDDDICVCKTFVEDLKRIVAEYNPDVIISREDANGIIPPDDLWMKEPRISRIGMGNFVVRREVWQEYADSFWPKLAADYNFIRTIWDTGKYKWYWNDVLVHKIQQVGRGRPE